MSNLPAALVGVALLAVLGGGAATVASAAVEGVVPTEIHHRVEVVVGGTVTVETDLELDEFRPGQLIPDRLTVDGLPEGITVRVPVTVDGDVAGQVDGRVDGEVRCTGCPR